MVGRAFGPLRFMTWGMARLITKVRALVSLLVVDTCGSTSHSKKDAVNQNVEQTSCSSWCTGQNERGTTVSPDSQLFRCRQTVAVNLYLSIARDHETGLAAQPAEMVIASARRSTTHHRPLTTHAG